MENNLSSGVLNVVFADIGTGRLSHYRIIRNSNDLENRAEHMVNVMAGQREGRREEISTETGADNAETIDSEPEEDWAPVDIDDDSDGDDDDFERYEQRILRRLMALANTTSNVPDDPPPEYPPPDYPPPDFHTLFPESTNKEVDGNLGVISNIDVENKKDPSEKASRGKASKVWTNQIPYILLAVLFCIAQIICWSIFIIHCWDLIN